jgi:hypothetical protein
MKKTIPEVFDIPLGNGLRVDSDFRLEAFGDTLDFGAFNLLDFATFAFPMNDLDGLTFASPSSTTNDLGAF